MHLINVKCISFDFTNANLKDYESTIFSQLASIEAEIMFGYVPSLLLNKFVRGNALQTRKRALKKKEMTAKSE
uniref:Uncharacterized protein n=1 Tax=Globodera pallida TaxID=36090 RepID=A0A183CDL8_GLOPA